MISQLILLNNIYNSKMEEFQLDSENKLFVFSAQEQKKTEKLQQDSEEFIKNLILFEEGGQILIDKMESLAGSVDEQKVRALGLKSKLEMERRNIKNKEKELLDEINRQKIELGVLQQEN